MAEWKIENTMAVSFDIKVIREDQKQSRNDEVCRASPTYFWSNMISLILKDTYMVASLQDFKAWRASKKWKANVNSWYSTNQNVFIMVSVSISQSSSELASKGTAWLHSRKSSSTVTYHITIPLLSSEFCNRCMINYPLKSVISCCCLHYCLTWMDECFICFTFLLIVFQS